MVIASASRWCLSGLSHCLASAPAELSITQRWIHGSLQLEHTVQATSQAPLNCLLALSMSRLHMKKNEAIHSWHAEEAWKTSPVTLAALPLPWHSHQPAPAPAQLLQQMPSNKGYPKLSLAALKHSSWEAAQGNTKPLIAGSWDKVLAPWEKAKPVF